MSKVQPKLGRRLKLTEALVRAIARDVERGAFLGVAAEANGVSKRSLFTWLERGRDVEDGALPREGNELFVELLAAVERAHARARLEAETVVHDSEPLAWLKFGPGREKPDAPGWTSASRDLPAPAQTAAELLLAQALAQLGLAPGPAAAPIAAITAPGGGADHGEGHDDRQGS
ncbi:MAG: hypothetical protein IT201_14630 [Thermoleophilia bacterium]|nr:hypothetical protein [Thermoleophilia bacterium]